MKKLILLLILAYLPFQYTAYAQCVIKSTIVKINSTTPIDQTHCKVNFDFIFTLENNSGNKYIYIHAWLQDQYPNYFCRTKKPIKKAPMAADLSSAVINIGINNDPHLQNQLPYFLDSYLPDPAVLLTNSSELNRYNYPTGDSAKFTVKGVEVILPVSCVSSISLKVDLWSSQASNSKVVHCFTCNTALAIDKVMGMINCSIPRTFNLLINSSAASPVSGTYKVFLNNLTSPLTYESFGPEDVLILTSPFVTEINSGINRFIGITIGYAPYNDTEADKFKSLWILVETNGYANQTLYFLVNQCASPCLSPDDCETFPIQIKSFDVKKVYDGTVLHWRTRTVVNQNRFEVQRKIGNAGFESIGFVSVSNRESSGTVFQFKDEGLKAGAIAFYRLKIIDKDNGVAYSEIRSVRNGASKMLISINPNPGHGYVNVQLATDAGTYNAVLFDYTGKVVKNFGFMQKDVFSINNMKPGMYVLKIYFNDSGEQIAERIIVQ